MNTASAAILAELIRRGWTYKIYAEADATVVPPVAKDVKVTFFSPAASTTLIGAGVDIDAAIQDAIAVAGVTAAVFYRLSEISRSDLKS